MTTREEIAVDCSSRREGSRVLAHPFKLRKRKLQEEISQETIHTLRR